MSFLHLLEFGGVPKILLGRLGLEDVISFAKPEEGSFYNSISTVMWFLLKLIIICSTVI